MAERPAREHAGTLIVVLGPSGSGKDTIIDFAREALGARDDVLFVRRVVTRDAAVQAEDHDTLDEDAFLAADKAGAFAFTWQAHGLRYGLPRSMDAHLASGGIAIANGSRATLPDLRRRYPTLVPVTLAVAADVLAARIAARGRESEAEIAARLQRAERFALDTPDLTIIDNNGAPEIAGRAFVRLIEQVSARNHAIA
ncbi:ribose 1,5-bisphosphate phosphokinase PhnN [Rhizobium albus]|nr:ribose 1,5-bisphosphate phosphokinase PhnN [Rhizobium albus]